MKRFRHIHTISEHAYRRADERLGLGRVAFEQWLRATDYHWMRVNADYMIAQNVKASKDQTQYITPWVFGECVNLVVSRDKCLVTIVVYQERKAAV